MIKLVFFLTKAIAFLIGLLMFWMFLTISLIMWDVKYMKTWSNILNDISGPNVMEKIIDKKTAEQWIAEKASRDLGYTCPPKITIKYDGSVVMDDSKTN